MVSKSERVKFFFAEKQIMELSTPSPSKIIKNETSVINKEKIPFPATPVKRAIAIERENISTCWSSRIKIFLRINFNKYE